MTFPFGDDEEPDLPPELREVFGGAMPVPMNTEALKAMFGGELPPGLEGMFAQLSGAAAGIRANEKALKAHTAVQLQRAGLDLDILRCEVLVSEAEVARLEAELDDESTASSHRPVLVRMLEAARKRLKGQQDMIPLLEEVLALAQEEAMAALGVNMGGLASMFGMGPGSQVPGDDVIKSKPKPQEKDDKSGDTPS